jgi:hypothetical protein
MLKGEEEMTVLQTVVAIIDRSISTFMVTFAHFTESSLRSMRAAIIGGGGGGD